MPTVIERLLQVYVRDRIEDERFIDTARRVGVAPFKEHLYATPIKVAHPKGEDAYA
jgi:sulfite reductase (NADPH) hemoprotein beta-component